MRGGRTPGRGNGGRGGGGGGGPSSSGQTGSSSTNDQAFSVRISGGRGSEPDGPRIPAIVPRPPPVSNKRDLAAANYSSLENRFDSMFADRGTRTNSLEHEGVDSDLHTNCYRTPLNYLTGRIIIYYALVHYLNKTI